MDLKNNTEKSEWMNERVDKGYSFRYIKNKTLNLNVSIVCVETKEMFHFIWKPEVIYKIIAEKLWSYLDDIDTLSDIIKPANESGFKAFYLKAMDLVEKRHSLLQSDGYDLRSVFIKDDDREEKNNGMQIHL